MYIRIGMGNKSELVDNGKIESAINQLVYLHSPIVNALDQPDSRFES